MNFFPSPSVETPQLQLHRLVRAHRLGLKVSLMALVLGIVGMLSEVHLGNRLSAIGDAVIAIGGAGSWLLTRRRERRAGFSVAPILLGFWLGGALDVYGTGGLNSPDIQVYIFVLFLGGVLLQSRFSRWRVAQFCLLNLAFWGLASVLGIETGVSAGAPPAAIQISRYLIYTIGFFVLMEQLFRSEELFVSESESQAQLLRTAQADMAHAEKLAQVGKLVATTAHEFAQPVQVITMCASMLRRGLPDAGSLEAHQVEGLRNFVLNIQDASARLGRLLNQLREFSRKDQFNPRPFDCREALRSVETMVHHDLENRGIRFVLRLPRDPLIVIGDVMNAQQILFNLVSNGRDAALRGQDPLVEVELKAYGRWARIQVRNSGPGIPIGEQARIFDPYYTTKRRGEGTGLGLPVCQDLATLNKGRILFCSGTESTIFVVDLPLAEEVIGS